MLRLVLRRRPRRYEPSFNSDLELVAIGTIAVRHDVSREPLEIPRLGHPSLLGATHTIIWTIFCSGDIGKAVGRRRLRLAALKNETLVWLGNTIGDVTEDFRWLSKC